MDPNPPSSSQGPAQSIDDLLDEIAFQKVLLSSIDDSVQNREEAEAEVRAEITALERQLRKLRNGKSFVSSQSGPSDTHEASHNDNEGKHSTRMHTLLC